MPEVANLLFASCMLASFVPVALGAVYRISLALVAEIRTVGGSSPHRA